MEQLISDGRIHPARIEEVVQKVSEELEVGIRESGEQATFDVGAHGMHMELIHLIGRLKYRTSYGQNILQHSLEVAFLCGIMAAELNLDVKKAKRAGLLHDIGKAVDHEVEGSHAVIGRDLAKKYGEAEDIVYAIGAHHEDQPPKSVLDVLMLSAARLPAENARVSPYLVRTIEEHPLSYQLLLTEEKHIPRVFARLHSFQADAVDLNLGCPAPMVRQAGGGSSLMEQPERVRRIVAAARKQTAVPLTAKIRLGESLDADKLRNFCRMLEGEGIDLLTVHARLRAEPFVRPPRWEWVGRVKEWVTIPVIANGSIDSVASARDCLRISGADGLMIGRRAAVAPWIFAEIAREVYGLAVPPVKILLPVVGRKGFGSASCRAVVLGEPSTQTEMGRKRRRPVLEVTGRSALTRVHTCVLRQVTAYYRTSS
ncbi:hypothetical protein B566_EDAN019282 [Ephemera danica]|nr:hypothetical protein B566_EDAN019282 [Ephemera danica]